MNNKIIEYSIRIIIFINMYCYSFVCSVYAVFLQFVHKRNDHIASTK